jgi:sugar lactone lactonase YvrE
VVTGEISVPEVRYPIRVAAEPSGSLVVLDGKSRRLARLQPDGTFGRFIDVPAAPEQRSVSVRGFAMDARGRLFVLDGVSRRIVVLGPDGSLERAIAVPESLGVLSDVAVDGRGGVYALDGVGRRVHVARADETSLAPLSASLAEDLDFPAALDVDASGRIFVADENGGGIVILGRDGSFRGRQSSYGWRPGYLRYPTDLCANGRGLLMVADRENHRVQVFQIVQ